MDSESKIYNCLIIGLLASFILISSVPFVSAANLNSTPVIPPFITIDPIGNHTIGDIFFINGTTNLPVSGNLTMELQDDYWASRPHSKNEANVPPPGWDAYIPYISIVPDSSGTNRWSTNLTDPAKKLNASIYLVGIWAETNGSCDRLGCSLSESPKASNETVFTLFPVNLTVITNITTTQNVSQIPIHDTRNPESAVSLPMTTYHTTPIPWFLSITAIFALILIFKFRIKK